MEDRTTRAGKDGRVSITTLFLVALCVGIAGLLLLGRDYQTSLLRADCMFLTGYLDAWEKAGRPNGNAFVEFQQGRPPEIQISNRVFHVNGVAYRTQFASTNLRGGSSAILYITENRVLLLEGERGEVKLVDPLKGGSLRRKSLIQ